MVEGGNGGYDLLGGQSCVSLSKMHVGGRVLPRYRRRGGQMGKARGSGARLKRNTGVAAPTDSNGYLRFVFVVKMGGN